MTDIDPVDLSDPGQPGHSEIATWDAQATLPSSVPGLILLAQLIEARSWATP